MQRYKFFQFIIPKIQKNLLSTQKKLPQTGELSIVLSEEVGESALVDYLGVGCAISVSGAHDAEALRIHVLSLA